LPVFLGELRKPNTGAGNSGCPPVRFVAEIASSCPFPENYLDALAPAFVNSDEFPFDLRRKISQDCIRGGVDMKSWGNQEK
jgi:hypothetical protein